MIKSKRRQSPKIIKQSYRPNESLWRTIIIVTVVFLGVLFLIGILMGFHPPQPDSPILYRITSARHTHKEYSKHQHHGFHHHSDDPSLPTIFVAMPSVNDPDCNASIISAFENAALPHRIYFGVHQQTDLDSYHDCLDISSIDCPTHPLCTLLYHVRISRVTSQAARGPTWGRYMADKHYKGETFYFITDSHTLFRKNWDNLMIEMWQQTANEYAILTHYPKGQNQMKTSVKQWETNPSGGSAYHICGTEWESSVNHMPRNANGCYAKIHDLSHPIVVPFWAAGFSFSKSHFRDVVPFDPHTQWLFHGEEFLRGTKLWTFGYDFYSPQYDIVFHRYADRGKRGKMPYTQDIGDLRDRSEKRVNYLWGLLDLRTPQVLKDEKQMELITQDIDKYGLGDKRNMDQFWEFVACDPINQNITVFKQSLWSKGGLRRVPWNPPYAEKDPVRS
eukprot:239291_1